VDVREPKPSRPYMPGYGTKSPTEGRGLLPWSWAEERLAQSHDYWVATVQPDGRPHLMPVWGVWDGDA
jgi:pyridoxamine 5'-phosphate oxidase-like protein